MEKENRNLEWEELHTEHLVRDAWIDFRKTSYRFPDGAVYEPFYTYNRRDYAVIAATDEEGRFLCVRQFRQGIRQVTLEFPAGGIENADDPTGSRNPQQAQPSMNEKLGPPRRMPSVQAALAAAKRELQEETGCVSDEWEHLLSVPSCATIADNYAHLFYAKNCRHVSGQQLDPMEFLSVERCTKAQIQEAIEDGSFAQAMHILAWKLADERKEHR